MGNDNEPSNYSSIYNALDDQNQNEGLEMNFSFFDDSEPMNISQDIQDNIPYQEINNEPNENQPQNHENDHQLENSNNDETIKTILDYIEKYFLNEDALPNKPNYLSDDVIPVYEQFIKEMDVDIIPTEKKIDIEFDEQSMEKDLSDCIFEPESNINNENIQKEKEEKKDEDYDEKENKQKDNTFTGKKRERKKSINDIKDSKIKSNNQKTKNSFSFFSTSNSSTRDISNISFGNASISFDKTNKNIFQVSNPLEEKNHSFVAKTSLFLGGPYKKLQEIEKPFIREFRQFCLISYKNKKYKEIFEKEPIFWEEFLDKKNKYPPFNFTGSKDIFNSYSHSLLIFIMSKNGINEIYDKFLDYHNQNGNNKKRKDCKLYNSYIKNLRKIYDKMYSVDDIKNDI